MRKPSFHFLKRLAASFLAIAICVIAMPSFASAADSVYKTLSPKASTETYQYEKVCSFSMDCPSGMLAVVPSQTKVTIHVKENFSGSHRVGYVYVKYQKKVNGITQTLNQKICLTQVARSIVFEKADYTVVSPAGGYRTVTVRTNCPFKIYRSSSFGSNLQYSVYRHGTRQTVSQNSDGTYGYFYTGTFNYYDVVFSCPTSLSSVSNVSSNCTWQTPYAAINFVSAQVVKTYGMKFATNGGTYQGKINGTTSKLMGQRPFPGTTVFYSAKNLGIKNGTTVQYDLTKGIKVVYSGSFNPYAVPTSSISGTAYIYAANFGWQVMGTVTGDKAGTSFSITYRNIAGVNSTIKYSLK